MNRLMISPKTCQASGAKSLIFFFHEDMSKIYARPLPRVYAILMFAIAPPLFFLYAEICWVAWAAWALADYSMANRKIAYTLGRGRAYIFDMSSTSGYMGEKYFQEFGPRFFDMSSASGYMGAKYFQKIGPRFLAWLTNGSGSEYIQFVIPWDIQSIRGGDIGAKRYNTFGYQ